MPRTRSATIIDQLLGNRYNVTDRQAVSAVRHRGHDPGPGQYGDGYNGYGQLRQQRLRQRGYRRRMRVTAITNVQRRNNGLRVSGLMSSGYGGQYGNQYGYQNRGYAG